MAVFLLYGAKSKAEMENIKQYGEESLVDEKEMICDTLIPCSCHHTTNVGIEL